MKEIMQTRLMAAQSKPMLLEALTKHLQVMAKRVVKQDDHCIASGGAFQEKAGVKRHFRNCCLTLVGEELSRTKAVVLLLQL